MQSDSHQSDARLAGAFEGTAGTPGFAEQEAPVANEGAQTGVRETEPASFLRYRYVKRALDLVFILLALPVLVPVMLVVAIVVKLTSPGPLLFSHRRICKEGAFFSMLKFRTMCVNSSEILEQHLAANPADREEWVRYHKLRNDPRITPVGNFLRRSSLDELPQVFNVLSGRMSLVGPRPIVAAEVERYGPHFPLYTRVKPGVTGLWQVSGRSEVTYVERVQLDCHYVRNWSLLRDLHILLLTARSVVNRDGAY